MGIPGGANLLLAAGGDAPAYEIDQSLRFVGSAYLSRTPSSAGNRNTWTSSFWIKKALDETSSAMHTWSSTDFTAASFNGGSTSTLTGGTSSATVFNTTAKYKDPSAWMHIVTRYDSTQSGSNKFRIYINGAEYTGSWLTDNRSSLGTSSMNNTVAHYIGNSAIHGGTTFAFQGYMAEFHHVDGSSLDPTSFGEYDNNGVWRPIEVSGLTYSTNGFYLKFDPSATNGIGHDHSGNGNNFTATGFNLTSSSPYYSVVTDTPTNNHAILNSLFQDGTISQAGLNTNSSEWNYQAGATIFVDPSSNGKYYLEAQASGSGTYFRFATPKNFCAPAFEIRSGGSDTFINCSRTTNAGGWSGNNWVGFGIDYPNQQVVMWKTDGTTQTWSFSGLTGWDTEPISAGFRNYYDNSRINFGQLPFQRNSTIPSGWVPWNTASLPEPSIKNGTEHFNTVTWTGNGASSRAITGVGFKPDFVWIKSRSANRDHFVYDVVRGSTNGNFYELRTSSTQAEGVPGSANTGLRSLDSDGFTVGSDASVNQNNDTYVAWCWKGGGSGTSNTSGSITSTVSANPTAGFSIVSYTGTGSTATVGHGLGVAPSMIIFKNRDDGGTYDHWSIYHSAYSPSSVLYFNADLLGSASAFFDTAPTSTVFQVKTENKVNGAGDAHIAYCFAEVEGYSKFGSYTGNGSTDGPFVWCGFKPSFVMIKVTNQGTTHWIMRDNKRDTDNPNSAYLLPSSSLNEYTNLDFDFLSNGFKPRHSNGVENVSGKNYIFAAFAEHPFGGDGVSPATAR